MSAIKVTLARDSLSHEFANVATVEWEHQYSRNHLINKTSEIGQKVTTITVTGFIIKYGTPSQNVQAQQALEDALRAIGTGTLSYTGATAQNVRFINLDFDEYRGSPVATYKAQFVTEAQNVHAHAPVAIGSLTLSISNGFEPPKVVDSIAGQGPDESLNNLKNRTIKISGKMVGSLQEVNAAQANLIAEVSDQSPNVVTVSLSSESGGVQLNVRPTGVNFGSPEQRGSDDNSRTYEFEGITHADYSQEPYTLGHSALTYGNNITLDVVNGVNHTQESEHSNGVYAIRTETAQIAGKKYFTDWAAYKAFSDSFTPLPVGVHFYSSPAARNSLELTGVSVGAFERDGNFENENKRYSAPVNLTFTWHKSVTAINQLGGVTRLAISWYKVISSTHSVSVDQNGSVTARSVSVNGQIFESELANAKGRIGLPVLLGDPALSGASTDYYITSLNITKTDTYNIVGLGPTKVYDISVTANQLDTNTKRNYILQQLFKVSAVPTRQMLFEKVANISKSISNRWNQTFTKFKVTSISVSVSGEIWESDTDGAPTNPNRGMDFMQLFDAQYEADFNENYAAANNVLGEFLPDNYSFFLNNMSFGEWQPFLKPNEPNKGSQMWRQSVTLSATAVFDLSGGSSNNQPDWIDTTSFQIEDQTTKFTELQLLGFGTTFKAIGINPSSSQTTIQRQFKDARTLELNPPQRGDFSPEPPTDWGSQFPSSDREVVKDNFEIRGNTARWVRSWRAKKEA